MLTFEIEKRLEGSLARAGRLTLPHGVVETPVFMPVGTKATVKALTPDDLEALGAQIILGNAYHLYMRPGAELVAEFGGLHGFSGWQRPFLTDSGGFQVFSLGFGMAHGVGKIAKIFPGEGEVSPSAPRPSGSPKAGTTAAGDKLCKVDEGGVTFRSHIDGSVHRFTPSASIDIQQKLGADIILAFDECTSPLAGHAYTRQALARTLPGHELRVVSAASPSLQGCPRFCTVFYFPCLDPVASFSAFPPPLDLKQQTRAFRLLTDALVAVPARLCDSSDSSRTKVEAFVFMHGSAHAATVYHHALETARVSLLSSAGIPYFQFALKQTLIDANPPEPQELVDKLCKRLARLLRDRSSTLT